MKLIVVALVALCQSLSVFAQMSVDEAFALGGQVGGVTARDQLTGNITQPKAVEVIQGYDANARPQGASAFGGNIVTTLRGNGNTKAINCGQGVTDGSTGSTQHCDAVNALTQQSKLPPTSLVTVNDPIITASTGIIKNPEAITGPIAAAYSGCVEKTVTKLGTSLIETCDETAQLNTATCGTSVQIKVDPDYIYTCLETIKSQTNSTCTVGRKILLDEDTNYQCNSSQREIRQQSCRKKLVVSCEKNIGGCVPSGIEYQSAKVTGFGKILVHPSNEAGFYFLSVGTIRPDGGFTNNYNFSGGFNRIFQATYTFEVKNRDDLKTFFLDEILWDDNVAVWLNDTLVFHSQGGDDWYMGSSVEYNNWCDCMQTVSYPCAKTGQAGWCSWAYFQGGANISSYKGSELKHLIKEGLNSIKIKVVIGTNGDAIARFKTTAFCPSCTETWDDQCGVLRGRAL